MDFFTGTYSGAVVWNVKTDGTNWTPKPAGVFLAGQTYRVDVNLYATSGYTFATGTSVVHSGTSVSVEGAGTNTGNSITGIRISFPKTDALVTELDLTSKVSVPVKDGMPDTDVPGTQQYTAQSVNWYKVTGTTQHDNSTAFEADTVYRVMITLAAAAGYTFTGAGAFTHSGGVVSQSLDGEELTVTITFPVTEMDKPLIELEWW
jgi:hypothetical protein